MLPYLFEFGGYSVSSFAAVVMVAFLLGMWIGSVRMRELGLDASLARPAMGYILVASVIGAKLYYTIDVWLREGGDVQSLLFARDGITFYGGLMGGCVGGYLACLRYRIPVRAFANVVTVPCALGQAIGRVGCFLAGDDYGKVTDLPWGIAFPEGSPPTFEPVHPTQLYETIWLLPIAALLWWRRDKSPFLLGEWLALNGFGRFFIEMVRINPRIGGLTEPQWIGIALVIIGALLWWRYRGAPPLRAAV